jgi:hypothetical protein
MTARHTSKAAGLDPRGVSINFSPEVKSAFRDLAAAVHFSEHFDSDMLAVVQKWGGDKSPSVHDVLIGFPVIAEQTFKHIHAIGDKRAEEAWKAIANELLERGFTLEKYRFRTK